MEECSEPKKTKLDSSTRLVEENGHSAKCSFCEKGLEWTDVYRCNKCSREAALCLPCLSPHCRAKHEVLDHAGYPVETCESHDLPITDHCITCKRLCCSICLSDHKSHELQAISRRALQNKTSIFEALHHMEGALKDFAIQRTNFQSILDHISSIRCNYQSKYSLEASFKIFLEVFLDVFQQRVQLFESFQKKISTDMLKAENKSKEVSETIRKLKELLLLSDSTLSKKFDVEFQDLRNNIQSCKTFPIDTYDTKYYDEEIQLEEYERNLRFHLSYSLESYMDAVDSIIPSKVSTKVVDFDKSLKLLADYACEGEKILVGRDNTVFVSKSCKHEKKSFVSLLKLEAYHPCSKGASTASTTRSRKSGYFVITMFSKSLDYCIDLEKVFYDQHENVFYHLRGSNLVNSDDFSTMQLGPEFENILELDGSPSIVKTDWGYFFRDWESSSIKSTRPNSSFQFKLPTSDFKIVTCSKQNKYLCISDQSRNVFVINMEDSSCVGVMGFSVSLRSISRIILQHRVLPGRPDTLFLLLVDMGSLLIQRLQLDRDRRSFSYSSSMSIPKDTLDVARQVDDRGNFNWITITTKGKLNFFGL